MGQHVLHVADLTGEADSADDAEVVSLDIEDMVFANYINAVKARSKARKTLELRPLDNLAPGLKRHRCIRMQGRELQETPVRYDAHAENLHGLAAAVLSAFLLTQMSGFFGPQFARPVLPEWRDYRILRYFVNHPYHF
jgi:hypothetical protein